MFSPVRKPRRCVIQIGRLKPPAKLIMRITCGGLGCFSGKGLGSAACCACKTAAGAASRSAVKANRLQSFLTVDLLETWAWAHGIACNFSMAAATLEAIGGAGSDRRPASQRYCDLFERLLPCRSSNRVPVKSGVYHAVLPGEVPPAPGMSHNIRLISKVAAHRN